MTRFRRTFPKRRMMRKRYDMQEFNLCRHPIVFSDNPDPCDNPFTEWTPIVWPQAETLGTTGDVVVTRGLSVGGVRFRYAYNCTDKSQALNETIARFWSGLIVAPIDPSTGAPLNNGFFPVLGNTLGDATKGVRILWRGLDFVNVLGTVTGVVTGVNVPDRYFPLEHVKSKAFLKEGMGLFWVTEGISGTTDPILFSLDLTMSLALRSVVR